MNSLLVCPHCNGAISRATQACPSCGEVTAHARSRPGAGSGYHPATQSVITNVIDALRVRPGRRRPNANPIADVVSDS